MPMKLLFVREVREVIKDFSGFKAYRNILSDGVRAVAIKGKLIQTCGGRDGRRVYWFVKIGRRG